MRVTELTPGQISLAVGVPNCEGWIRAGAMQAGVRLGGAVSAGGCVSLIRTVKLQLVGFTLEVHVTVVVPTGKDEPEGGVHVIAPQVPEVVGGA